MVNVSRFSSRIAASVFALAFVFAGCSDDDSAGPGVTDTTAPSVSTITPVDVTHVDVEFNENVQRASAEDTGNYSIVEPTPLVSANASAPGDTLIIVGAALKSDQRTVSLTTFPQSAVSYDMSVSGVKDVSGNTIGTAVVRSFTGTTDPDVTAPTLISRTPAPNATNVAIATGISLVFSEPITFASFTGGATLSYSVVNVPYSADSDDGIHFVMVPTNVLELGTLYTVTLSGLQDAAGNTMPDATWNFTTTNTADTTPPTLVSSIPAHNAVYVDVNTVLSLTFSEPVNQTNLEAGLLPDPGDGDLVWSNGGKTLTFTPFNPLLDNQQYVLTIGPGGVEDLSGNGNTNLITVRFSTGAALATGSFAGTITGDPGSNTADDPTGALVMATVGQLFEDFMVGGSATVAGNNTFDVRNLADNDYNALCIMDSNNDDELDPSMGDAIGAYGVDLSPPIPDTEPDIITITGGNRVTGINFQIYDFSAITGTVVYDGIYADETHFIGVGLFHTAGFDPQNPPPPDYGTEAQWPDTPEWFFPGIELQFPDGPYYVGAFLDANDNFTYDTGEPVGLYGGFPPTAINVQNGSDHNHLVIQINDQTALEAGRSVTWRKSKGLELPWLEKLAPIETNRHASQR